MANYVYDRYSAEYRASARAGTTGAASRLAVQADLKVGLYEAVRACQGPAEAGPYESLIDGESQLIVNEVRS